MKLKLGLDQARKLHRIRIRMGRQENQGTQENNHIEGDRKEK